MPATSNQLKKYNNNKVFVETGTLIGDGVRRAIHAGYKKIISIECHPEYYRKSKERFSDYDNIEIIFGDSSKILFDVIKDVDEPITFWLDAHYMWNDPNQKLEKHPGEGYVPTHDELCQIKKHHIKNHTILIDDIVHLNDLSDRHAIYPFLWGLFSYVKVHPPTGTTETLTENLKTFLLTVNSNYKFEVVKNKDGNFFECLP